MKYLLCILFLHATLIATAQTNITNPTVRGHWTLAGSPYRIGTNITIDRNDSLIIDPGVQIIFQGYYHLNVKGTLHAVGTASQGITFCAADTSGWSNDPTISGGWGEIYLDSSTGKTTSIANCTFKDTKGRNQSSGCINIALETSKLNRHKIE